MKETWDVVVVGAGAAGLFAAAAAAQRGRRTLVLEKNRKTGVKILMSGGTRCNITHDCSPREIASRFGHARKFLEFAVGRLPPEQIVRIINELGVTTKVEDTGKVFPVSNSAVDVRDALVRRAKTAGAEIRNDAAVVDVNREGDLFACSTASGTIIASSLVLTTGGKSYPGCGTTGDGYGWAEKFGHTIVTPRAALAPLVADVDWVRQLSGLTLGNCAARPLDNEGKEIVPADSASLLFTHSGLSGPLAMNLSRWFTGDAMSSARTLELDFLPGSSRDLWVRSFNDYVAANGRQKVSNYPCRSLPLRLFESLLSCAGIDGELRLAELGKRRIQSLADSMRQCQIPITGTKGFAKAEVTAGGVALQEVDNRTMRSRFNERLFLAGEILDFDGPIGGFNFQAAFSTGHLAGLHA